MTKSSTIKVLMVDDHQVVREGLRRIIDLDKEMEVVGEASNGEEAITKAGALAPDVIVMDLKMPKMDGLDATREIKERFPGIHILVLTLYAEDFLKQAMEAGVSGYLLKDGDCDQIIKAVRQVYDGLSPIAPSLTRQLVTEFVKLSRNQQSSMLSNRQVEILKLIAEGVNSGAIGQSLFISLSSVKREIRNIFDRLGVNDRAQAVSQGIRQGLI